MIQVLLDVIELEESKPRERIAFTPSRSYKRQMKAMLANPLRWAKNKARPMWKKVLHSAAVALLILSVGLGGGIGNQSGRARSGCSMGNRVV